MTKIHLVRLLFSLLLLPIFSIISLNTNGHSEDIFDSGTPHSSFHYELTRTLATAAGFSQRQSELIASVTQATDSGVFQGDAIGSPLVVLTGTDRRTVPDGITHHFARRAAMNVTNEYQHPGGRNTCVYFENTAEACIDLPELSIMENWAIYEQPLIYTTPTISIDESNERTIKGASLAALGIYLHSLADSYSHEPCAILTASRGHFEAPNECTLSWHNAEEFGSEPLPEGLNYTIEAAQAVWKTLVIYIQQNGLAYSSLWTEDEAFQFIEEWTSIADANERKVFADLNFDRLNFN